MNYNQWNRPYCGLTHYGKFSIKNRWATIEMWEEDHYYESRLWFPGCGYSPTTKVFNDLTEAKEFCEKWVNELNGV